jgi:hypothetical protein
VTGWKMPQACACFAMQESGWGSFFLDSNSLA